MPEQRDALRGAFAVHAVPEIDMPAARDAAETARQVPRHPPEVQHGTLQVGARKVRLQRVDLGGAQGPDGRGRMAHEHAD
jgi:hypothetical protein